MESQCAGFADSAPSSPPGQPHRAVVSVGRGCKLCSFSRRGGVYLLDARRRVRPPNRQAEVIVRHASRATSREVPIPIPPPRLPRRPVATRPGSQDRPKRPSCAPHPIHLPVSISKESHAHARPFRRNILLRPERKKRKKRRKEGRRKSKREKGHRARELISHNERERERGGGQGRLAAVVCL